MNKLTKLEQLAVYGCPMAEAYFDRLNNPTTEVTYFTASYRRDGKPGFSRKITNKREQHDIALRMLLAEAESRASAYYDDSDDSSDDQIDDDDEEKQKKKQEEKEKKRQEEQRKKEEKKKQEEKKKYEGGVRKHLIYKNKLTTDKNTECPIRKTKIQKGERYGQCEQCQYNISKVYLFRALRTTKVCPMCKSIWKTNKMYKNQ